MGVYLRDDFEELYGIEISERDRLILRYIHYLSLILIIYVVGYSYFFLP
jgi:hypothetical protein